jgi:manganese/iron transport system ATP-binding protein
VPEFCDRTVLLRNTVLAHGPTADVFTQANLEQAFGGVLRHLVLDPAVAGAPRAVGVITDDERPFVVFGTDADAGVPGKQAGN